MVHIVGASVWAAAFLAATTAPPIPGAGVVAAQEAYSSATYTYKRVGASDIQADVYRPPGDDVLPVVLWIHGGALIFGDRATVRPDQLRRYVGAGFAVVSIDYRLAPETALPQILEDVRDAYRWVRDQGPALRLDADRIAVVGNSAGAYLALVVGFSVTPRPKALVSFYGYGDLRGAWVTRPDSNYVALEPVARSDAYGAVGRDVLSGSPLFPRVLFYNYLRQHGLWVEEVARMDPDRESGKLERYIPILHVTAAYPPTLLLHGDRDTDVPFEESVRMDAELERRGVPHRLVRMRGYDHLFDVFPTGWTAADAEPIGLADPVVDAAYDDVVAFLREHVGR